MESDANAESKGIHPVDLVLMLLAISFAATLVLLDRFAIPAYVKTYAEFGAELPWVTRAVLSHVAPVALAVFTVLLGVSGTITGARGSRAAALGLGLAGVVVGIGSVAFCFYALYAPIFAMAGNIKP